MSSYSSLNDVLLEATKGVRRAHVPHLARARDADSPPRPETPPIHRNHVVLAECRLAIRDEGIRHFEELAAAGEVIQTRAGERRNPPLLRHFGDPALLVHCGKAPTITRQRGDG